LQPFLCIKFSSFAYISQKHHLTLHDERSGCKKQLKSIGDFIQSYDYFNYQQNSLKFTSPSAKINKNTLLETKLLELFIKDYSFGMKTLTNLNKNHIASLKET